MKNDEKMTEVCIDYMRTRIEELKIKNEELISKIQEAYGYLWHVNCNIDSPNDVSPPSITPEKAAYKSRRILRDFLTIEQRGHAINKTRSIIENENDKK